MSKTRPARARFERSLQAGSQTRFEQLRVKSDVIIYLALQL